MMVVFQLMPPTGGDMRTFFLKEFRSWKNTTRSAPEIIQLKNMRPIYDVLNEDKRVQVKEIYNRVFLNDNCIFYDFPLSLAVNKPNSNQSDPYLCQLPCSKTGITKGHASEQQGRSVITIRS